MSAQKSELPQLKASTSRAAVHGDAESSLCGDTSSYNMIPTRSTEYLNRLHIRSSEPRISVKDKVIIYTEDTGTRGIKHKLDFGTPRTQEAAAKAGLTFKDCLRRSKSGFFLENEDERIAQLTYERHCTHVQENIKLIYDIRKELVKKEEEQKGVGETVPEKKEKIIPGHFPSPLLALLSQAEAVEDPKSVLCAVERREMKNFIARAWKELEMFVDDQHRKELLSAISASRSRSPSASKITKMPSHREGEAEQDRSGSDKEKSSARKEVSGMTKDLDGQISERVKGRKLVQERIRHEESVKREKKLAVEKEWKQQRAQLQSIESKLEKGEQRLTKRNFQRIMNAARSTSNLGSIKERALSKRNERTDRIMGSYMQKADRIEQSKRKRENRLQEGQERRKKMVIDRKMKQGEIFALQKREGVRALQDYAKQLEDREKKTRELIESAATESKKYWREMTRVKEKLMRENKEILDRKAEHKRQLIWDSHKNLREKIEKKQNGYQTQQCFVRAQSISNRKGKENTFQFINLLMKMDLNKQVQREKLVNALQMLNSKLEFGLNLKLRLPSPRADVHVMS